jgi:dihydrofolate synthase/folylpolyglutamate synthase
LDATNIVTPRVAVITAISYDHTAVLGDTLTKIAGEKAGIIKPNVAVVSAPQSDEALEVLQRAARQENSSFTLVGKDVQFAPLEHSLDGQTLQLSVTGDPASATKFAIPLLGIHQVENAATAYAALKASGLEITDEAIRRGFAEVNWPARFEVARRDPPVIFDSAHNEESFARLVQTIQDYFPGRMVTLIFGASEDKNIPGMFRQIAPKIKKVLVTKSAHPRALEPEHIRKLARQAGVPNEAVIPVEAALRRALESSAKDGSIVLSAGSMFVTAEVMHAWNNISNASLRSFAKQSPRK